MSYSDIFVRRGVRIPTVLGILLVLVAVILMTRYLFTTSAPSSKGSQPVLSNLEITNITPTSLTVVWTTDSPSTGWVLYGPHKTELTTIAVDQRDSASKKEKYRNHIVTLKNLNQSTTYFFKPVVSDAVVSGQNEEPYFAMTAPKSADVARRAPAYGKVTDANGIPTGGALVTVQAPASIPLATLSKSSGEWLIPLNFVLGDKTRSLVLLKDTDPITITLVSEDGMKSQIKTTVEHLSPLPQTVVMGRDYDFTTDTDVLSETSQLGKKKHTVEISYPKKDAVVASSMPLIKGTAFPNTDITARLTGPKTLITKTFKAGADGTWKLSLAAPLSVGSYTFSIQTQDGQGAAVQKQVAFAIAKSGERVLAEATSSASPTITTSPTPSSTDSATLTPVATDEASPSAPVSGFSNSGFAYFAVGLLILGAGLLLAF